jgi:SAM-dependent methyltransferase
VNDSAFSSLYASTYDALYRDKDYAREARLVDRVLRQHAAGDLGSVLDLGSGTGNHALQLADLGYDVVGVERSTAMLEIARVKLAGRANVELHEGDIRGFDVGRIVDAALILFAVLGYQTEDEDVLAALRSARRHVRPGGLLAFDVWYGPAVLHERPSARSARIPVDGGELLRVVTPVLDVNRQLCRIHYELSRAVDGEVVESATEEHTLRFFFPNELRLLVGASGFELLRLTAFPDVDSEPDETTWNVLALARAV